MEWALGLIAIMGCRRATRRSSSWVSSMFTGTTIGRRDVSSRVEELKLEDKLCNIRQCPQERQWEDVTCLVGLKLEELKLVD